jgi:hypothetical protein
MTTMTPREVAVRSIADGIADRTSFVATVPPGMLATVAAALARIPSWTAWLDCGLDAMLCVDGARLVADTAALFAITGTPVVAVVTICKTVPAKRISKALGCPVPPTGVATSSSSAKATTSRSPGRCCSSTPLALVDPSGAAQLVALATTSAT